MRLQVVVDGTSRPERRPASRRTSRSIADNRSKGRQRGWQICALVLISLAIDDPVFSQSVQYTPPGAFQERREDTQTLLERNIAEARWKAGRALFDPWFGIRDAAYVDNVGNQGQSDTTLTLGAGVRGWLPVGSEFTLAAHVLPEYVWWKDLSQRNRLNGRYGMGIFGNLGNTGIEATIERIDDAQFFSREFEDKVNTSTDQALLNLEFAVGQGLAVFAGGGLRSIDYEDDPDQQVPSLSVVDRDELNARAGVKLELPRGFEVGIGAEYTQADFEPGASDLSNSGPAAIFLVDYVGPALYVRANFAYRTLEADGDSVFVDYDGLLGRAEIAYRAFGRVEFQLFGGNDLVYSFSDTWAYFEDTSIGIGARLGVTEWFNFRLFVETGDNDYTPFVEMGPNRLDDYDAWGIDLNFKLRRFAIYAGGSLTDYTSNLPDFDRDVTQFRTGLTFGIGSGKSWN